MVVLTNYGMSSGDDNLPPETNTSNNSGDSVSGDGEGDSDSCDSTNTPKTTGEATKEPELNPSHGDTNKETDWYNLGGWNQVIIFNQEKFEFHAGVRDRHGTQRDVDSIKKTFKSLGWRIKVYNDLTVSEIREVMGDLSEVEYSAIAIFILSHGENNDIVSAYDSKYNFRRIIQTPLIPYNCPGLSEKPKMIFIQACQGDETDSGTPVAKRRRHASTDSTDSTSSNKIPTFQDFLIAKASYADFVSFRSPKEGSWFIQAICSTIDESDESESIDDILTTVRRKVSRKESNVPENPFEDEKKQIPQTESTLIYKVLLKKKFIEVKKSEESSRDDTLVAQGAIKEKKEKKNKDKPMRSYLSRIRDWISKND